MIRIGYAALALSLALGCRAARSHEPHADASALDARDATNSPRPAASTRAPSEAAAPRSAPTTDLLPPTPAEATPCEASCGALHGCLVLDGQPPHVAASIEIGCLENCVAQAPPNDPPFGCARPEPVELPRCEPFRACVEQAWVPVDQLPPPSPFDDAELGAGCERVCQVYASCRGLNQASSTGDREAIDKCIQRCQLLLEPSSIERAEACTRIGECAEIQTCLEAIPRAS